MASTNRTPLYIVLSAMIAMAAASVVASFLFPRLFGSSTQHLERRLLGDTFEYQDQVRAQIDRLESEKEYHEAIAGAIDVIGRRMRVRHYVIALLHPTTDQLRTLHAHGCPPLTPTEWQGDATLFRALRTLRAPQIDLDDEPRHRHVGMDGQALRTRLSPLGAERIFALGIDEHIFGLFAVGVKADGSSISTIDRELLATLATKLARTIDRINLTEQAAAAAKLEHVAMMSRGLAHDLNNLITPISSFLVHIDGHFPAGSVQAEVHGHASRSIKVMQDYVRDAMFFGKRLAPKFTRVDVEKLLSAVRELTLSRATPRAIRVVTTCASRLSLMADALLLQRLLVNLVNNAVDASTAQTTVMLSAQASTTGRIRFEVKDEGCGIPEDNLSRVFEPYFTTKQFGDEVRGFGLGLSICRKIVDLHQGTIAIDSEVGRGTSIVVELPGQAAS